MFFKPSNIFLDMGAFIIVIGEVFLVHYSIVNITITFIFVNISAGMLTCVKKKSRRSQRKKFF